MIKLKTLLSEKYLGFGLGAGRVKEQSMTDLAQGLDRDPMTGNPMPGGAGGTVNLDYNGAEVNATANTNITTVQYNVTVIGDNSAFNATLEAGKGNFQVTFSWHPSFGVFIEEIDGIAGGCAYWQLLHNGESSMVGASTLLLAEGDSITWNYNTDYC